MVNLQLQMEMHNFQHDVEFLQTEEKLALSMLVDAGQEGRRLEQSNVAASWVEQGGCVV